MKTVLFAVNTNNTGIQLAFPHLLQGNISISCISLSSSLAGVTSVVAAFSYHLHAGATIFVMFQTPVHSQSFSGFECCITFPTKVVPESPTKHCQLQNRQRTPQYQPGKSSATWIPLDRIFAADIC